MKGLVFCVIVAIANVGVAAEYDLMRNATKDSHFVQASFATVGFGLFADDCVDCNAKKIKNKKLPKLLKFKGKCRLSKIFKKKC